MLGESRVMDKLADTALESFIAMLKWRRGSVYNYKILPMLLSVSLLCCSYMSLILFLFLETLVSEATPLFGDELTLPIWCNIVVLACVLVFGVDRSGGHAFLNPPKLSLSLNSKIISFTTPSRWR